ncbi:Glutathione S-transferase GstB [Thalassovita gelatinovora]|uniref:Glutathione S-transferase GstB n=1 Tax=Thalassovita gelatinovora TaxID=53501 RepID=A0A0P1G8D3_THAGE|nr:glutathione S-transferase family protein [Thalassovita gelatinovora]QIZ81606.1 glutathione S-transferase family protein [Thalassovita gelatinovora]CUH68057.1 Glutathione S-transferase GstB [Thalassovita gelatinovora]SEQ28426.1 Glutathione S-transferase [Thalassovita gelatinovora]
MRLWGRTTSVNVQKVLWTLEELGLDYDRLDAGGAFGGLDTAEYAALNPTRRVPTLLDGELVIWESNVIVRYLARAYGDGTLAGATAAETARADMWMEWFQNNPYSDFIALFYQTVRLPQSQRDPAALDRAVKGLTDHFRVLDAHLSDRPYVAGDRFSMGDITVGASLWRYYRMDFDRPALPALAEYYDRLGQRAAYRSTVMTSYDSLRPTTG